jgi:2-C-methyl-D-erythritol 4-phosphate cytidylyltransferase
MGAGVNKVFLDLGGVTILEHTLSLFATLSAIREIVLVVSESDRPLIDGGYKPRLDELGLTRIVNGGRHRIDSSRAGVAACSEGMDLILIHDAARPFAPAAAVNAAMRAAAEKGAAILAVPVEDTLKISEDGVVVSGTQPRDGLFRAQTPQVFRRGLLLDVLAGAGSSAFTDDALLVETAGHPVVLVPGGEHNIKITTPEQLELARAIYRMERNGKGIAT